MREGGLEGPPAPAPPPPGVEAAPLEPAGALPWPVSPPRHSSTKASGRSAASSCSSACATSRTLPAERSAASQRWRNAMPSPPAQGPSARLQKSRSRRITWAISRPSLCEVREQAVWGGGIQAGEREVGG